MKKFGRLIVVLVLEWQVRRLRKKNNFKVVAVAGSVGKTSTKTAAARVLSEAKRVRYQEGNYNDRVTVPLIFFDHTEPKITDIPAWLRIFWANEKALIKPYLYDIVVVELGTDAPGQMMHFAYLKPDITVLTAIEDEHMQQFGTIDAVASEELTVFDYSAQVLVNISNIAHTYVSGRKFSAYRMEDADDAEAATAAYRLISATQTSTRQQKITMQLGQAEISVTVALLGEPGAKTVLAAAAVSTMLGLSLEQIKTGLEKLEPFPGRMQILQGIQDTIIIDDTYNASPIAVKTALDSLYKIAAPQKIAVLGSMNELGESAKAAHEAVAKYCDPSKLSMVITIGKEANDWIAPIVAASGCATQSFIGPYSAGDYLKRKLTPGAAVLFKGSQNGVFAEEAIKPILADPADMQKLVRQSPYWIGIKNKLFSVTE